MKKIMLAMFFASITLFATASAEKKAEIKTTLAKKEIKNLIVWEIRFTCNGTPGTMCCFNTEAEAQAFINSHSAQWFCDYVNQP